MRVLLINSVYGKGSTGTIVADIQHCCNNRGIECYIAYSESDVTVPYGYKIGNFISNKLHALLYRIGGKQGYFSYFPTTWFLGYVKRLKPDIIHLHNLHSNYINLKLLLRFLSKERINTVVTLHDCWYYTGGCYHYTFAGCHKWKSTCGNCPKRKTDTKGYIIDSSQKVLKDRSRFFSSLPSLVVTGVSNWICKEAETKVFSNRRVVPIYNGVDTTVFKPIKSMKRELMGWDGKFVMMGPSKKWLLPQNTSVLHYFSSQMKPDEVLVLFGFEGKSLPPDFPSNVITLGYTSSKEELAELYSSVDVFVNCTREESLSLVNVEAQACGTPVVTFDGTGVQETVNNICGFSVPTGDYKSLLDTVRMIKSKGKPYYSMSCIDWVCQKFKLEDNYAKYIDLYEGFFNDNKNV